MKRRLLFMAAASAFVAALWALPASAGPLPSGERINGGTNGNGGTVIEPVYDDMTGQIRYVSTPRGVPNPVHTNPVATAPFYLPVYPAGATIGTDGAVTLNCQNKTATTTENCPDHGPAVAGLAQLFEPNVYPGPLPGAVAGHDHLMAGPGSHGDFNVAWVPTLILFTYSATNYPHITTLDQLNSLLQSGAVIKIPLDGTPYQGVPLPNLTFHCSVVSAAVYDHSVPFTG
jgi:hypothetical protein